MEDLVARFIEVSPILGINDDTVDYILRDAHSPEVNRDVRSFLKLLDNHLMEKTTERTDLSINSFSKKIEALVWNRLMVYSEYSRYRDFLKKRIFKGFSQFYDFADSAWYAVVDKSTDFSFYTKRMTLAALYASTLVKFTRDYSYQFNDTRVFLKNRIENILSFAKFKSCFTSR